MSISTKKIEKRLLLFKMYFLQFVLTIQYDFTSLIISTQYMSFVGMRFIFNSWFWHRNCRHTNLLPLLWGIGFKSFNSESEIRQNNGNSYCVLVRLLPAQSLLNQALSLTKQLIYIYMISISWISVNIFLSHFPNGMKK